MRFYKTVLFLIAIFSIISCDSPTEKVQVSSVKGMTIDAKVISQAGYSWTDESKVDFLASPVNVATYNDHNVLIISNALSKGTVLSIKPIGAMKVKSGDDIIHYIIGVPAADDLRNVNITSFSDLITTYSSAKWIIEQYVLSRNGLGAMKLISWEDEHFVTSKLL